MTRKKTLACECKRYAAWPEMRTTAVAVLLSLTAACQLLASEFHTSPYCWSEARVYSEERDTETTVRINRVDGSLAGITEASPNKAYAFYQVDPDRASDPHWNTEITIYNERPYVLQVVFPEAHAVVRPQWVNEKLLFVRVWWGRIAGTDYLIDVEREAIILTEPFRYGAIAFQQFKQCETPDWSESEACQCYPDQPEGWRPQPLPNAATEPQ